VSRIFKGQDNHGNFINRDDLNPDQEDVAGAQPVDMDVRERSQPQQLIIRPGESGGVLTQTEVQISRFCAEEKL
jgi:hypothetical protein